MNLTQQPFAADAATPTRLQKRSYVGTIGALCDVVTSVNDHPVARQITVTLSSGASVTVSDDGAWIYRPPTTSSVHLHLDSFAYTLQTPAGSTDGTVTITLKQMNANQRSFQRQQANIDLNRGDGTSAVQPLNLSFEIPTGCEAILELRDNVANDKSGAVSVAHRRGVVVLDSSKSIVSMVQPDGLVHLKPRPGFVGTANIQALVETETGRGEWINVEVRVFSICRFDDSRQNCCASPASPNSANIVQQQVFLKSASPAFHGQSQSGAIIDGKLSSEHGDVQTRATADAAGYWAMRFRGAAVGRECTATFTELTGTALDGIQVLPPTNSDYRLV